MPLFPKAFLVGAAILTAGFAKPSLAEPQVPPAAP